jgi:hypothetical protein
MIKKRVICWILRASMMQNGTRIYARDYGKRAFRIPIYK